MLGLGNNLNRQVILALQPLSGFENNSTIENEKIKKMWSFYPRIREVMELATRNNDAKFVDLSIIFKEESNASINFFDEAHLTVTGQEKVAKVFAKIIKSLEVRNPQRDNFSRLKEETINNILTRDFSGEYKTVEDY